MQHVPGGIWIADFRAHNYRTPGPPKYEANFDLIKFYRKRISVSKTISSVTSSFIIIHFKVFGEVYNTGNNNYNCTTNVHTNIGYLAC
jgi:hypothetical protein